MLSVAAASVDPVTDWERWHDPYQDPLSDLSQRLAVVQRCVRDWVAAQPAGPLRIISVCAGQARDLVGALRDHERRQDACGLLVELAASNVEAANASLRQAGLDGLHAVVGDAGHSAMYAGWTSAELVLVCGVFGNVSDRDVGKTIEGLPTLCEEGATVIWTRHRRYPELTPAIRAWFDAAGFEERTFDSPGLDRYAVGVHQLVEPPQSYDPDLALFTFTR